MKSQNLISTYQGEEALERLSEEFDPTLRQLRAHETQTLHSFCDDMISAGCYFSDFENFFIGYEIPQIGKEFDLLRFGKNYIINIELKSDLNNTGKEQKIQKQLEKNFYYLKFLGRRLHLFTYVLNDGYYEYAENKLTRSSIQEIAACMREQILDPSVDPNQEFLPSNYLVSPFNSTDKFLKNEYFLTTQQQQIKDDICTTLNNNVFKYFALSAGAGTGKTLLTYDIAKYFKNKSKNVLIIHCGKLNNGQSALKVQHNWNIISVSSVYEAHLQTIFTNVSLIIIDESQRIHIDQLEMIIETSRKKQIPIIFAYDVKQYLKDTEGIDIKNYLQKNYSEIPLYHRNLTNKIRTNKNMASFITNLLDIGKSKDHLNYDCISINYFENKGNLQKYMDFLKSSDWVTLTYTTSRYKADPFDGLTPLCEKNAHNVIGQEFPKVAFIMDNNFRYSNNKLVTKTSYYSSRGMLYQIVTRAIDELKIIVYNNPQLYLQLLKIKNLIF